MEYLSLPHTRASSYKLVPEVDDTLLTNLRNPIITFVEDSTPGAHDTLTAACDANLYTALGVDKPAEHGSCAENLVLALKELNENAGLKGTKAVGADISVNIAPTPLHLFMAAPITLSDAHTSGAGAKGAQLAVEAPQGKKRGFVRFRAERDVVVVFSACPMDVGPQNGGRCMAANFMVEASVDDDAAGEKPDAKSKTAKDGKSKTSTPSSVDAKAKDKPVDQDESTGAGGKAAQKSIKTPDDTAGETPTETSSETATEKAPEPADQKSEKSEKSEKTEKTDEKPQKTDEKPEKKSSEQSSDKAAKEEPNDSTPAKPKKKPKKLQVRSKPEP